MIYLLRLISDENQDFIRDIVAKDSDTFLEIHHILQENLGYDPSQLASFFITNAHWEKKQEITLLDMMQDSGLETRTMEEATLGEFLQKESQRMIYVFDFFSERAFFVEVADILKSDPGRKTPFVAKEAGTPPPQLALDQLLNLDGDPENDPYGASDFQDDNLYGLDEMDEDGDFGMDPGDLEDPDDF